MVWKTGVVQPDNSFALNDEQGQVATVTLAASPEDKRMREAMKLLRKCPEMLAALEGLISDNPEPWRNVANALIQSIRQ